MRVENLHEQSDWDSGYQALEFGPLDPRDQVGQWLESWTRDMAPGSCLEVGCFPGRYLTLFGQRGFELHGIDLTPRTASEMADWLRSRGYRIGEITQMDFFNWNPDHAFDVVYSSGFIEHFANFEEVLLKHASLVKPGGRLLVAAPNFRGGFQKFFHQWIDRRNLEKHYLPSMNPALWAKTLERAGFKVLYQGYFPGFDFWVGEQDRTLMQKTAFWSLRTMIPMLRRILPKNAEFSSPYCGIVAEKGR